MLGFFKKKTRKAVIEVKKMENRDAVEATVWGAYMIAYADGNCDEKKSLFWRRPSPHCQLSHRSRVRSPR